MRFVRIIISQLFVLGILINIGYSQYIFTPRTLQMDPRSRAAGDILLNNIHPINGISNPAYLTEVQKFGLQVSLSYDAQASQNGAFYIPVIGAFSHDNWAFGIFAFYLDYGPYAAGPDPGQIGGASNKYNLDFSFLCAKRIDKNISLGIGLMMGYEQNPTYYIGGIDFESEIIKATSATINLGMQIIEILKNSTLVYSFEQQKQGLTFGFSICNIGPKIRYGTKFYKRYPPWMGKVDLSWMIMNTNSYEFQIGGTLKWLLVNENRNITFWGYEYWMGLGCELKLFSLLALRGGIINHGWENTKAANRGTVGIGFNFEQFWFDCSLRKNMPPSDEMVPWLSIGYKVK